MFNHFPVKEGLVFDADPPMRAALLDAVRRRPAGESVSAAAGQLRGGRGQPARHARRRPTGVAEMARVIRGSRTLQVREREILGELTDALAALIAEETGARPRAVEPWLAAHAVLGLYAALLELARDRVLAGVTGAGAGRGAAPAGPARAVPAPVRAGGLRQARALRRRPGQTWRAREQLVGAVAGEVGVPGEQGDGHHVAVLAGPAAPLGAEPPDVLADLRLAAVGAVVQAHREEVDHPVAEVAGGGHRPDRVGVARHGRDDVVVAGLEQLQHAGRCRGRRPTARA